MPNNLSPRVRVSIVTISKDDALGLGATVQSVLAQSHEDFECIVVRSGTSQLANLPADRRIVVVDVPARGISSALNAGVERACGDWVQFLNGGDRFLDGESLQRLVASADSTVRMVLSFARVDGRSFTIPRRTLRLGSDSFLYASHQATLFRRSLFEEHGLFTEEIRVRMDLEWLARLPPSLPFAFVEAVTVHFDATGVSASNVVQSSLEEAKILWRTRDRRSHALAVVMLLLPFRVLRRAWRHFA